MLYIIVIVISVLAGSALGTIFSLGFWSKRLARSNILGDTTGGFDEYSQRSLDLIWADSDVQRTHMSKFFRSFKEDYLEPNGMKPGDYSYIDEEFPDDEDLPEVDIPLFKPLQ